jgi:hypothetical protein
MYQKSIYEGFAETDPNAVCLNGAQLGSLTFPGYVQQCLKGDDATRLNTIFNSLEDNFIQAYSDSRAQFGNLINTYNGVRDLKTKTNSSTQDADATIMTLEKKKKNLEEELKRYKSEAEAKNQSFLDSILQGTPKETLTPTLQDATLLIFWFGWGLLAVTLVAVRWLSPGGGWRAGLFAAILILLVTLCLYAVLQKIA